VRKQVLQAKFVLEFFTGPEDPSSTVLGGSPDLNTRRTHRRRRGQWTHTATKTAVKNSSWAADARGDIGASRSQAPVSNPNRQYVLETSEGKASGGVVARRAAVYKSTLAPSRTIATTSRSGSAITRAGSTCTQH